MNTRAFIKKYVESELRALDIDPTIEIDFYRQDGFFSNCHWEFTHLDSNYEFKLGDPNDPSFEQQLEIAVQVIVNDAKQRAGLEVQMQEYDDYVPL